MTLPRVRPEAAGRSGMSGMHQGASRPAAGLAGARRWCGAPTPGRGPAVVWRPDARRERFPAAAEEHQRRVRALPTAGTNLVASLTSCSSGPLTGTAANIAPTTRAKSEWITKGMVPCTPSAVARTSTCVE